MWQVSVLLVFQRILADRSYCRQRAAREVVEFVTSVTANLMARLLPPLPSTGIPSYPQPESSGQADGMAESRSAPTHAAKRALIEESLRALTVVELLFWKPLRDVQAMRDGYHWKVRCGMAVNVNCVGCKWQLFLLQELCLLHIAHTPELLASAMHCLWTAARLLCRLRMLMLTLWIPGSIGHAGAQGSHNTSV